MVFHFISVLEQVFSSAFLPKMFSLSSVCKLFITSFGLKIWWFCCCRTVLQI